MRGTLMMIGGAEDKLKRRTILKEFVARAGGADARIALVPTASAIPDEVVAVYRTVLAELGDPHVDVVNPRSREQAHDPGLVDILASATGIFMTGGNQLKLGNTIVGTPVGDAIVAAHRAGVLVAGTSAGASIQSAHMVAFGTGGATPKQRMTQVAAGLGLVDGMVIDQHFDQRNRYGRLLMIVSQSPSLLGIGIDEDTAAIIEPSSGGSPELQLRVVGRGSVTIVDASQIVTNAHEATRSKPLLASNVRLHVLPAGYGLDLATRTLLEPVPTSPATPRIASLQEVARDLAAADASPASLRRRRARQKTGATATSREHS